MSAEIGEQYLREQRYPEEFVRRVARAVADALLHLGKEERLPHECRAELAEGRAMKRAAFFKDYFWTETGKRMAAERYGFFLEFLERLAEEVVEAQAPPV